MSTANARKDSGLILDAAEERAICWHIPLILLTAGRIRAQRAEHAQAVAVFERGERHARQLDMLPLVWQTQAESARSLEAIGRAAEAAQQRANAHAVIDEIAGRLRDETLRVGYLASAHAKI